jgi:hypothetical protein
MGLHFWANFRQKKLWNLNRLVQVARPLLEVSTIPEDKAGACAATAGQFTSNKTRKLLSKIPDWRPCL